MRASTRLARLAVCAAALSAAGCGAASSPTAPHVNLSISAPTNGATVGVHKVTILGTVSPAGAQVAVNGRPARVSGSTFTGTLYVSASDQKIVVSGAAHGYLGSQESTTVTYSANVAHQIVASAAVENPAPTPVAAKFPAAILTQAFGLPAASLAHVRPPASVPAPHGGSASGGGSVAGRAHSTSGSSAAGGSGSSSSSSTGGGSSKSAPVSTPSAPAPPTPAQIAAAIRDSWVHGCVSVQNGGNIVPYCTCTYTRLAGQLQTRAAADQLIKEMAPYLHTGDFSKLPRFIQRAVRACISKLPPVAPSSGPAVVSQLPGVQHGATTTPAQTTSTASTPAPPPPAPVPPTTSTTTTATSTTSTPTASTPTSSTPPTSNVVTASAHSTMVSALKDLNNAISAKPPTPLSPTDRGAVGQRHAGAAKPRLTPHGGHQGLRDIRVIAHALGYALHWVGDHDRSGSYPYGNRVQRRLYDRLSAALKLAS